MAGLCYGFLGVLEYRGGKTGVEINSLIPAALHAEPLVRPTLVIVSSNKNGERRGKEREP